MSDHPATPAGSPNPSSDDKRRRRSRLLLILLILLLVPVCLWAASQMALLGPDMDEAHENLLSRLQATYAPWGGASFDPVDPALIGTIRADQATFAAGGGGIGVLVPFVSSGGDLTQIAAVASPTPTARANPTSTQPQVTSTNVVIFLPETATGGAPDTAVPPPTAGQPTIAAPTTQPPPPSPPPDTKTPQQKADLAISNSDGTATYSVPGTLTYTITVSNLSAIQVNNARVSDILPPGMITVGAVTWTCAAAGAGSLCPAAGTGSLNNVAVLLGPAGTVTFTLVAPVAPGATGSLVTTASVTPPASITDPNPGNNSATDTDTPAGLTADLSIIKTDNRLTVLAGAALTYVITVSNSGPTAVTGAAIDDTFAGVNTVTWSCIPSGGATCAAGITAGDIHDTVDMPAGSQIVYTANATVNAAPLTGSLVNSATVTAPVGIVDPNTANNSATDTDQIGKPDVVISVSWTSPDTLADIDLWVYEPGALINAYQQTSPSGGTFSGDRQCTSGGFGLNEQESVNWPAPADVPPSGTYDIYVYDFRSCGAPFGTVTWTVTATVDGIVVATRTGTITGQVVNPTSFIPAQSVYCPGTQLFQAAAPAQAQCNLLLGPPPPPPPPSDDPRALGDPATMSFTLP